MSELQKLLLMIRLIAKNDMTMSELENILGVTRRTITRYVTEARCMGADLTSAKCDSGHYVWKCNNWDQVKTRVNTWYALEESRDLLAADDFSLEG